MDISLKIHNLTNLTGAVDILKNHGPTDVTEFGEAEFVAYVPVAIATGAMVSLNCTLQMLENRKELELTGKVLVCRKISEEAFELRVQLRQYDKPLWAEILEHARRNQTSADTLFQAIKGEEP